MRWIPQPGFECAACPTVDKISRLNCPTWVTDVGLPHFRRAGRIVDSSQGGSQCVAEMQRGEIMSGAMQMLLEESVPVPPSPEQPPLAPYDPPEPAPQAIRRGHAH